MTATGQRVLPHRNELRVVMDHDRSQALAASEPNPAQHQQLCDPGSVSAIWMEGSAGSWSLQTPAGYANEAALHDMVMSTPQLLPLSGSPKITVIGREVALPPAGYADVVAVEEDGRPVIIEVKLRNNAESRRAVIAQTLSYAASLHAVIRPELEEVILGRPLHGQSIFDRVRDNLQDEQLSQSEFEASLETHLAQGSFRAVIVLDEAPTELINLVGYLESVTTGLSLDLIAVHSYLIGDHRVAVPQRLDPEHAPVTSPAPASVSRPTARHDQDGADAFRALIADSPAEYQQTLIMMADWGEQLAAELPDVTLKSSISHRGDSSLRPLLRRDDGGLVTLWRGATGKPSVSLWRSVIERRAPDYLDPLEQLIGEPVRQGGVTSQVTPALLQLLDQAYRPPSPAASTRRCPLLNPPGGRPHSVQSRR